MRIGLIYLGIELLFSLEIALTVPIMLESHVSESIYSYVYFLSPLLGFLFQPILGDMSDRCNSRFGRRRPFILALALSSFVGIGFILNGRLLGKWAGDATDSSVIKKDFYHP
jgi:solute carrier family 45 protein 1/2/4